MITLSRAFFPGFPLLFALLSLMFAQAAGATIVSPSTPTAHVRVQKGSTGWHLLVNGQPFYIKGVGCNAAAGKNKEDYLLMARDLGANTVRTWGDTTADYFDKAQAYGLKVNAGIWLNPVTPDATESYVTPSYRWNLERQILAHVRKFKNHPALLSWTVGDEVFKFTKGREDVYWLGRFYKRIVDDIHREDPNHPVIYAASGKEDFECLKAFVPNLDIVGINTYGGFPTVVDWLHTYQYDKPIIATEFGVVGAWDRPRNENSVAYDTLDQEKTRNYIERWREIKNTPDCLGGFAFVLGDPRNQDSLTWNNLNFGEQKRQSYGAVRALFAEQEFKNHGPVIAEFKVERVANLKPKERISVSVSATAADGAPLTYKYFITDIARDALMVTPSTIYLVESDASADKATIEVPQKLGLYRVYAAVSDPNGNVAIANVPISVGPMAIR